MTASRILPNPYRNRRRATLLGLIAGFGGAMLALCAPAAHAQTVVGWGLIGFSNFDDISNDTVKVAAGGFHTVVLRTDGSVACWGRNDLGQCSVPSELGPVSSIAAGLFHNVALRADGSVACWGSNTDGQCDVPAGIGPVASIAAGDAHTVALKTNGSVTCWGNNGDGQCNVPGGMGPIASVAAGAFHTVALRADGSVACWGYNGSGQCNVPAGLRHRHAGGSTRAATLRAHARRPLHHLPCGGTRAARAEGDGAGARACRRRRRAAGRLDFRPTVSSQHPMA